MSFEWPFPSSQGFMTTSGGRQDSSEALTVVAIDSAQPISGISKVITLVSDGLV